jgi:hypothetical protein
MSTQINGGYVHPTPMVVTPTGELMPTTCYGSFGGMTLRDWFAGMALQGKATRLSNPHEHRDILAADCYDIADAMLAARKEDAR